MSASLTLPRNAAVCYLQHPFRLARAAAAPADRAARGFGARAVMSGGDPVMMPG